MKTLLKFIFLTYLFGFTVLLGLLLFHILEVI